MKDGKCCICGRVRAIKDCVVFDLTPAEEATFIAGGVKPESTYVYCQPCLGVMRDASAGPNLMRGILERELLRLGIQPKRAKQIADRYHGKLVELRRRARHPTQS